MRAWTLAASFASLSIFPLVVACGNSTPQGSRDHFTTATGGSTSQAANNGAGSGGKGGGTTGGGILQTVDGGKVANPCDDPDAPADCELKPSRPACGDGKLNQDSEECDDHNGLPGDGCSGTCKKEPYYDCPKEGEPCVSTIVCGDSVIGPGEACDDGNTNSDDGCSSDCHKVEIGYACRNAGAPCSRVFVCGDGRVDPNEGCDDNGVTSGDG